MKQVLQKHLITLFKLTLAGSAAITFGLAAVYLYLSPNLPSVDSVRDVKLQTPLRVYSSDGKLIGEFGEKRRAPVSLEEIPLPFIDALLAAEDADFYSHHGVSIKGLARAVAELIKTGEKGSGGSTLTMQLTRNIFLSLDQKFVRKFNEILLSLKLERELSKDEILELYVNYMFLGKRAYGIQAAARVYYGKDLSELSLAQLAMIAGLFQGPSTQNPIINPTRALERRNWILKRMYGLGLVAEDDFQTATNEPVTASYHGNQLDATAPYAAELAREKTIRSFGLKAYTEGYKVYTTVDSRLQLAAQDAVVKGLLTYDARHGYRGPEQSQPSLIPQEPTPETTKDLLEALQNMPDYAGLMPAAILSVEDQAVETLSKTGEHIRIGWEQGLSTARAYINENARGPAPQNASELFSAGDIIRIKQNDSGIWQLSQLPKAQAALVALNPDNGAIKSIVGGFDFYESQFNRATTASRQPGSNFKPFIYTAALEHGLTAASLINDSPIVFDDDALETVWRPKNDGNRFYGPTRIRKALYRSVNLVSIRILQQIGIETAAQSMERFGFDPKTLPRDLTLALGSTSVTPIDLATAWSSFANGGYKVSAYLIDRVMDVDGNIIYGSFPDSVCGDCPDKYETGALKDESDFRLFELPLGLKRKFGLLEKTDYPKAPKIIDDQVTFIMDSMLKDVIQRGTGRKARELNRVDIAGKTGTTNGPLDAWFSGYNSNIVATAWVGFDQNEPLGNNEYGGSAALPIWIDFMRVALKDTPIQLRKQPPGIVTVKINPETGERTSISDPDAIFEFFRSGNEPKAETKPTEDAQEQQTEIFSGEIF